jgi:hypothetical protein
VEWGGFSGRESPVMNSYAQGGGTIVDNYVEKNQKLYKFNSAKTNIFAPSSAYY